MSIALAERMPPAPGAAGKGFWGCLGADHLM